MALRAWYSDHYLMPLPEAHRFPAEKYRLTREALVARGIMRAEDLVASEPVALELVRAVHDDEYVTRVLEGTVDPAAWRRVGFPWSPELVTRSLAAVGGTLAAARWALGHGFGGNLAGGTHHAFRDRGEGFCIFNDIAIVSEALLASGAVARVAVVDLDVHQGNGNAAMLGGDERVFVFSMHGERNFPLVKVPSTLDVGLADGTGDAEFLVALAEHLPAVMAFRPQLVLFQAGVDALAGDRFGRLALTHAGMRARDEMVLAACRDAGAAVCTTLGGGYAKDIGRTVEAYVNTYAAARAVFG